MSWQDYIKASQGLGFTKSTIIARANYQTLASTSKNDIASAWQDGKIHINENQELLDDWKDSNKQDFCFYQECFDVVLRDTRDGYYIVGTKNNEVIVARQFKTIWHVASGTTKEKGTKKRGSTGFNGAVDAFIKIENNIWEGLAEAGVRQFLLRGGSRGGRHDDPPALNDDGNSIDEDQPENKTPAAATTGILVVDAAIAAGENELYTSVLTGLEEGIKELN